MAGLSRRNYIYSIFFFFFANAKSFLRKYIFPLSKARMTSRILLLLLWWVHAIFITFFNFLHLAKKSWNEMVRLNLSKNFSTKINSLENGMVCSTYVPTFFKPLSLLPTHTHNERIDYWNGPISNNFKRISQKPTQITVNI